MIPLPYKLLAASLALVAAYSVGRVHQGQSHAAKQVKAERDQAIANLAEQQRLALNDAKNRDRINEELDRARRDAANARAAFNRLHDRPTPSEAIASTGDCKAIAAAADLYANLFREADEAAGELATEADGARTRGAGCERHSDAVSSQ